MLVELMWRGGPSTEPVLSEVEGVLRTCAQDDKLLDLDSGEGTKGAGVVA